MAVDIRLMVPKYIAVIIHLHAISWALRHNSTLTVTTVVRSNDAESVPLVSLWPTSGPLVLYKEHQLVRGCASSAAAEPEGDVCQGHLFLSGPLCLRFPTPIRRTCYVCTVAWGTGILWGEIFFSMRGTKYTTVFSKFSPDRVSRQTSKIRFFKYCSARMYFDVLGRRDEFKVEWVYFHIP